MSDLPRRKLIEVALPLDAINAEGRRDKSLNRRHPKALHWWWARRPLAVCRAIIFAQLVDDPSAHPDRFPTEGDQARERERLFELMRQLVRWDRSSDRDLMHEAHAEIANSFEGSPPVVVDPFCGGGSIPVEATRLGLESVGADLNPVAVLITKAMIEIPARYADRAPVSPVEVASLDGARERLGPAGLATDVAYYGQQMIERARERVGVLYLEDRRALETGDSPLAWLWARTVRCPNPVCGAAIPLMNSFWLSRSSGANARRLWAYPKQMENGTGVEFEISTSGEPPKGTVFARNSVRCLVCDGVTSFDHVKAEGVAGRMGQQLVAVNVVAESGRRCYRGSSLPPTLQPEHLLEEDVPTEEIPFHPQYLQLSRYGFTAFNRMFTSRQLKLLSTLGASLPEIKDEIISDGGDHAYADAIMTYLAFFVDRVAARNSAFSFWNANGDKVESATATNYVPMRWFFAEANPFADASGGLAGQLRFLVNAIASLPVGPPGRSLQLDATRAPRETGAAFCTDPPYFDSVPYADLSDFYYVWLKRSLAQVFPDLFSTILTPKASELVADNERHGDRTAATDFFRQGFRSAFDRMMQASHPDVPVVVYYAVRQGEQNEGGLASTGWEAMLQSLVDAGFAVTATWPVRTEKSGGLRSHGRNALASSVVIACRQLPANAPLATIRELTAALQAELPTALRRLQQESIAPIDLAQAAIGPGMAVFSRYTRVIEADGTKVPVRRALQLINAVLDELLAEQEADFDTDTRWCVAWFEQHGMNEGPFGDAENLSRAKNTTINGLVVAGVIVSARGTTRLLDRSELEASWDPSADPRLTVWEVTQHLIASHQNHGEQPAAELLRQVGGGLAEAARELAYRLFAICERKGWAQEALAYNALVTAWPEITRLAAQEPEIGAGDEQEAMEV